MDNQNEVYDAIIIGLGAMGSSALYQLSKTDLNVLGVDRFDPPHNKGSSHGETRITREAIAEGKEYVHLVRKSHEIWKDLEKITGSKLFSETGFLLYGPKTKDFILNTINTAQEFGIVHQTLDYSQLSNKYKQYFNMPDGIIGYFEPGGGYVFPEECIKVQLSQAKKNGARVVINTKILAINQNEELIEVTTETQVYKTKKVVVTAGAWTYKLVKELKLKLKVYKQILFWYRIKEAARAKYDFSEKTLPAFNWELNENSMGDDIFIYGFPSQDGKTVKIASEFYVDTVDPDDMSRLNVLEFEVNRMRKLIEGLLPWLDYEVEKTESCLYTVSPDNKFIIDEMFEKKALIASGFSGHGFKHSAGLGVQLAKWINAGKMDDFMDAFLLDRFDHHV